MQRGYPLWSWHLKGDEEWGREEEDMFHDSEWSNNTQNTLLSCIVDTI